VRHTVALLADSQRANGFMLLRTRRRQAKRQVPAALICGILLLGLATAATSLRASASGATPEAVQQSAEELLERVFQESQGGGFTEGWVDLEIGAPLLIHAADLRPVYYVIPCIDPDSEKVATLVGVDASTGMWQWYAEAYVDGDEFPLVSLERATEEARAHLEELVSGFQLSEAIGIEMPNMKLYWRFAVSGTPDVSSVYISFDDPSEIITDAEEEQLQGLAKIDDAGRTMPLHVPSSLGEPGGQAPDAYDIVVTHYFQEEAWYCAEAALQMVFDYFGPSISQDDIGDVANEDPSYGTYASDIRRAAHFSNASTAIQAADLVGYDERALGYGAHERTSGASWLADLREVIADDQPVIMLGWYSNAHQGGHFRLVKGYNHTLQEVIVHDPWYAAPFQGPNQHFSYAYFEDLWERNDYWGLMTAPWDIDVACPASVGAGSAFVVSATAEYVYDSRFASTYDAVDSEARIALPGGYGLAPGETPTKAIEVSEPGDSDTVTWTVIAPTSSSASSTIAITASGRVAGASHSYASYEDDIGGSASAKVSTGLAEGVDVALAIDRSGSMGSPDKLPVAKNAAGYFVDSSRVGDQVAVSAFDDSGMLVHALTEIVDANPASDEKMAIKAAIDAITPGDLTNFGAGLQIAYDELDSSALAQDKFAVLMSNGQHNTGTYAGQVQAFAAKGWPIYTIGFGSDANEPSLQGIADDTGGKYYFADPAILTTIYDLIRADMTGNALLAVMQWLLQQGQMVTYWLPPIDPFTTLLHFLLNWGGSDVNLILIRPNGTEVTPADAALDPNITYHKTDTYVFYTVNDPEPGSWGTRIVGADLPGPEIVTLSVTAASPMVCTFYGFQATFSPGDPMPIVVQLRERDGSAIAGASVEVDVVHPLGGIQTLALLDDGAHDDQSAGDGIYGNTYSETAVEGFYGLDVSATGNYSGGAFSVQLVGQVLIGSPSPEPGGLDDDFEYSTQNAMDAAGWTRQGLWHLTTEAETAAFAANATPFPSSTHAVHFCDPASGSYATVAPASVGPGSSMERARRAQTGPMAGLPKSYGELASPAVSVTGGTQVDLRFDYFRQVEYYAKGSYDKTYVQVRFDNGGQWQTVWELDSATPSQSTWMQAGPIPIAVPAGASVMRVKFVFDSVDDYYNGYLGWLIDDVSISGLEPTAVSITTQVLPAGTANLPYSVTLSAAGGTPPYAWSATGLPGGLSLNASTGVLAGTPAATGVYSVTASVTDSTHATALRTYQLAINPASGVAALYSEDFADPTGWTMSGLWHTTPALQCANLAEYGPVAYYGIDTACDYDTGAQTAGELTSPGIAVLGTTSVELRFDHFRQVEPYASGSYDKTYVQVQFDGGQWQTVWELDSASPSQSTWMEAGPIPIGVPTEASVVRVRFVFDSVDDGYNGYLGWLIDDVSISGADPGDVIITTQVLPAGTANLPYSVTLSAAGGTPPYAWSATGLPGGLSLNASTGVLAGRPAATGVYSVTASVTDSTSASASRDYQLTVNPVSGIALYLEDFTDPSGWVMSGLWHVPTALQCADLAGHGLVAYYGIDAACNYETGARTVGTLTSPPIDIPGAKAVRVRFDYFRQVEFYSSATYDMTRVEARLDGGSWSVIWMHDSTNASGEAWSDVALAPFATDGAQTLQVRFAFDSVDGVSNDFIGWLVDNVCIESAASGGPLAAMATREGAPRAAAGLVSVLSVPNPIRDGTGQFVVRGVDAEMIRVEIYDLSGLLVWEGEGAGNELPWSAERFDGAALANGVYLYRVSVLVSGTWLPGSVQKLVILR